MKIKSIFFAENFQRTTWLYQCCCDVFLYLNLVGRRKENLCKEFTFKQVRTELIIAIKLIGEVKCGVKNVRL